MSPALTQLVTPLPAGALSDPAVIAALATLDQALSTLEATRAEAAPVLEDPSPPTQWEQPAIAAEQGSPQNLTDAQAEVLQLILSVRGRLTVDEAARRLRWSPSTVGHALADFYANPGVPVNRGRRGRLWEYWAVAPAAAGTRPAPAEAPSPARRAEEIERVKNFIREQDRAVTSQIVAESLGLSIDRARRCLEHLTKLAPGSGIKRSSRKGRKGFTYWDGRRPGPQGMRVG